MSRSNKFLLLTISLFLLGCTGNDSSNGNSNEESTEPVEIKKEESLHFSFEDIDEDSKTTESVSGDSYLINYVFNKSNQENLFKEANLPLQKEGVSGKSLYMDGFSTKISLPSYITPTNKITLSSWVAPRVFENLSE